MCALDVVKKQKIQTLRFFFNIYASNLYDILKHNFYITKGYLNVRL